MNFINSNTIKIAISASIAILVSNSLGLQFGVTSGIIAILSIQNTKKDTIIVGIRRFIAGIIAVLISYLLYVCLGNNSFIFGLFLLIFIPLTKKFNIEEGMVAGAVLSTHLLVSSNINITWIYNEVGLLTIGIGVATLFNLYMPSLEEKFNKDKVMIENLYRRILLDMSDSFISKAVSINEQKRLDLAKSLILESRELAYKISKNNIFKEDKYYLDYVEMRSAQLEVILKMRAHFSRFTMTYSQMLIMSEFTREIAQNIYFTNDCIELLKRTDDLRESYKKMDLPKTREEFENRAMLLQFLNDLEDFLILKNKFVLERK
ncbi:aromatic acid exporter family protein [Clostridium chrysemydis]|uniref:aromatic acid exporter family protein n=1 Tax=Clostridium chrysemydis TaxID=2665504 RepID=UPI001883A59E|nr:aromatic acid exporter family protein [Clostridium chrysemydis]